MLVRSTCLSTLALAQRVTSVFVFWYVMTRFTLPGDVANTWPRVGNQTSLCRQALLPRATHTHSFA